MKEIVIGRKIEFHCKSRFFNPLKKRTLGEIIPYFQLLPVIGIGLDYNLMILCIDIGWLNFYCHIWIQQIIKKQWISS